MAKHRVKGGSVRFFDKTIRIIEQKMVNKLSLWAPEMAKYGGIQNYMWRLWEMLSTFSYINTLPDPVGLSLTDDTRKIQTWSKSYNSLLDGAKHHKLLFILKCLSSKFKDSWVIVGHLHLAPVALIAKQIGFIKGYVVILHGVEAWTSHNLIKRTALVKADRIIATTQYTAKLCADQNKIDQGNFSVIPLCSDTETPVPDHTFKLLGDFPILFVGRLISSEGYKGLDSLISVIARFAKFDSNIILNVIGDGDERSKYELQAKEAGILDRQVIFHGNISENSLISAYQQANVFAMPSWGEGFGIVFLEAMRAGIPCIGGNHGGTPEVIVNNETGYLVDYGDEESLFLKLSRLKDNNNLRKRLSVNAKKRFNDKYQFQAFTNNWKQLLETLD